jgi:transcriptional regulatory protein GAL4
LTRSNLTAAEDRVRDLEIAFKTLFPEVDLNTVLSSIAPGVSNISAEKYPTVNSDISSPVSVQTSHDGNSTVESLPREADGFDWTENEINMGAVADGMAALSINPEGAGYLGTRC